MQLLVKIKSSYVLLVLGKRLRVVSLPGISRSFMLDGQKFYGVDFGSGFHGHHDWLRDGSLRVVGVRQHFIGYESFADRVRMLPYVVVQSAEPLNEYPTVEIYISDSRVYEERLSDDYAIGTDEIYFSEDRTAAIAFDIPLRGELLVAENMLANDAYAISE